MAYPPWYHLGGGMSVWAQAWAYEQRAGSAGAKAVLVALAVFADEEGFCYPSQERIAGMTEQGVRTVRLHLASLESSGFISRERRRRKDGTWTSDGFHLLAPAERLRPHIPAPDETLRQILPVADIADGKNQPNQRQISAHPAAKNSSNQRQILPGNSQGINHQIKPSEEPSVRESARAPKLLLADFQPNEKQIEDAISYGVAAEQVAFETEQWRDYHAAKGDPIKDFGASWRTWMRRVQTYSRGSPNRQHLTAGEKNDQRVMKLLRGEIGGRGSAEGTRHVDGPVPADNRG